MKFKNLICTCLIAISISSFAFSDDLSDLNDCINNFRDELNTVIPNAATQTNVYADAWIGKFIPSLPMHFAAGIDGGITKFDISELKKASDILHITNLPSSLLFPTINANAKIGGIFLPFDVGFSIFYFNSKDLNNIYKNIDIDFFTVSGNLRWAILQGKGICPKWSIGAGYYYSKGSIGKTTGSSSIKFSYVTQTFVAETQVSKKFLFVTPFVGFRAIFCDSDITCSWNSSLGIGGVLNSEEHDKQDMFSNCTPQIFGGVGISIGLIEIDVNASYDFKHTAWSAGTSLRFQM